MLLGRLKGPEVRTSRTFFILRPYQASHFGTPRPRRCSERLFVLKIRAGLFIFNFTPGIFSASTRSSEQTLESNWSLT